MFFKLFSTIFIVIFFNGCFFSKSSPPQKSYRKLFEPTSHEVTLIESSSSDEVLLNSTGIGEDLSEAIFDSKLASLWFVLKGGNTRLLNSKESLEIFSKHSKKFYQNVDKYITYVSDIKSKKKEHGKYRVRKNYKINVRILKDDLITDRVIKDVDAIAKMIDFPIISLISRNGKVDKNLEFVSDTVLSYLSEKGFEAEVVNQDRNINKTVSKSIALSGDIDPLYLLAVNSGSDIYISINPNISTSQRFGTTFRKASVSLKAFYTVSKKLLASSTGHSQELSTSSNSLILEEATNGAVDKLLSQIIRNWTKESKHGKYFRVILKTEFLNASKDIYSLFRKYCRKVSRKAGQTVFNFNVQCKARDSLELLELISENYKGEGKVFREFDTNSLLVIKIGNSEEDDDFEIE